MQLAPEGLPDRVAVGTSGALLAIGLAGGREGARAGRRLRRFGFLGGLAGSLGAGEGRESHEPDCDRQ